MENNILFLSLSLSLEKWEENSSSFLLLRQATQNSSNWRRVWGETQDTWAWHPSDKITKIIRRNWPNHPSQKSINYIGAKNHPLLTSVPQNVFVHWIYPRCLPPNFSWVSQGGREPYANKEKKVPRRSWLCFLPPLFSLWGSPKVDVMLYVRRTQKEQHFSVSFCFFFVTPRSSARIFMWDWKKNICPIGVRLWPVCTRSLWNCTISFIRLWGLLVLYFRMLDDIGKPESLFSRPCSISLGSPWLFCFQRVFSHSSPMTRWIAVAALAHD